MFRCVVDRDWVTGRVRIYVIQDGPPTVYYRMTGPHQMEAFPIELGDEAQPFMTLNEQLFAEILKAASDFKQPSEATQVHLADAMKLRDRLMTLVERQALGG